MVYKIDRLSPLAADLTSRLVEGFDRAGDHLLSRATEQSFSTTTLDGAAVPSAFLLSFAQVEREVIAERVRDKIGASRQKGMWMAGSAPGSGDVAEDRKLLVP